MFLLGVHVDQALKTAFFVTIEKRLKNVRHQYTVKKADQTAATSCQNNIAAFYNNNDYTIRKRIFSQDRRPKKDVSARPTIIVAANPADLPLIDSLRGIDVPVEAVLLNDDYGDSLPPAPGRAGIGKNHPASEKMIYETLTQVLAQQRVEIPTDITAREAQLLIELERALAPLRRKPPGQQANDPSAALLLAMAAPIWFRENIRYSSAYRTSATSIRKYK